jgi:prevent-host-death family protein
MKIEIGAYEAKTKLPELLRGVQAGKQYTITNRGAAVADLVPVEAFRQQDSISAVKQMQRLMADRQGRSVDIKALIAEGRR